MKNLVKNCKEIHNISVSESIRLGTLYEFRQEEFGELNDGSEGRFSISVNYSKFRREYGDPDKFQIDPLVAISGAKENRHGLFNVISRGLKISNDKGYVEIDGAADAEFEADNCFIFCMSEVDGDFISPFSTYSSQWSIPYASKDVFSSIIANDILEKISESDDIIDFIAKFPQGIPSDLEMTVNSVFSEVTYGERSINLTNNSALSHDQYVSLLSQTPFFKPKKYALEREFRFIFYIESNYGRLPIRNAAIYIPSIKIRPLVPSENKSRQ